MMDVKRGQEIVVEGLACSRGIGIGTIRLLRRETAQVSARNKPVDPQVEKTRFAQGLQAAAASITALKQESARRLSERELEIFDAHLMMLEDDDLLDGVNELIQRGLSAEQAVERVCRELADELAALDSDYLRERAADMLDIGQRLIAHIRGSGDPLATIAQAGDGPVIIAAEEILPTEVSAIADGPVSGMITQRGGIHSHYAIIARAYGIPAVVGVNDGFAQLSDGDVVIVDGDAGSVIVRPSPETLAAYRAKQEASRKRAEAWERYRWSEAVTRDGRRMRVEANLETVADADVIDEASIDGVGLFRTEFIFMESDRFPDLAQQIAVYSELVDKLKPLPITFRTLDVGGDKPLPYYPIQETNPFLGYRGIRISLTEEDMFRTQLKAIYVASRAGNVKIMFPMVQGVKDFLRAKAIAEQVRAEVGCPYVPIGCMIEVPSAVLMIDEILAEADFASIGTNDLTQYLLASDRLNERVAPWYNPYHPAVLKAIAQVAAAGKRAGKDVTICGEMAGDPAVIPVLIAMGITGISMSKGRILAAKAAVSETNATDAEKLVARMMRESQADEDAARNILEGESSWKKQ